MLAAPVETLADLAALVVVTATASAPEPDSAPGKLEGAARSILAAGASAYAVTDTRPDTEARRLHENGGAKFAHGSGGVGPLRAA